MPSCLGIYIENTLIKYAKVSKEHDSVKVESFGVKFCDNVEETIKQIISETYSFKTPISINLGEDNYTYAQVFSLLNKTDIEKAADTEFDFFCSEKGKNKNALQYKKIFIKDEQNTDRLTALYVYTEKSNIISKLQLIDGSIVSGIYPEAVAIQSLREMSQKDNNIIINIEKNTSITTIANGELYRIDTMQEGMKTILDAIKEKENSYNKAYEICKNTTLYTAGGAELQSDNNEYLEDIIPTLYNIIENTKDIMAKNNIPVQNIYITGTGAVINNIDLYFQESFNDKKCDILKPYFLENVNLKINIKDYIEVNSAIALALNGLNNNKEINFKNETIWEKISKKAQIEIGSSSKQIKKKKEKELNVEKKKKGKKPFRINLGGASDIIEKNLIRGAIFALILVIVYSTFSIIIINQISDKQQEINNTIEDTNSKITDVANTSKVISTRSSEYANLISKIQEANNKLVEQYARKNAIPNFLNKLMVNVPKGLQVLSIKNTSDKHITIEAKSKKYDDLGYLKAGIKSETILTNVTSTSGDKKEGWVYVTIDGNLPY